MKERMFESTCPHCGHTFWIKRDTVCVAGIHPSLEDRLDENIFFMHHCSQCHNNYSFYHPFLYRNPDENYVIILSMQQNFDNLDPQDELYLCSSISEFEMIYRIKRQHCQVEPIKKWKQRLEELWGSEVVFDQWDENNQCLWFWVNGTMKGIALNDRQMKEIRK